MVHRPDLNALSAADRKSLVKLMLDYIDDSVVSDHMNIVHSGVQIFTGHRAYIAGMETYLAANGGSKFVPLPMWNPANPIPAEFNVVKPTDSNVARPPLQNLNPNKTLPAQFEFPAVCSFASADDLGNAINGWHGSVHIAIGGTMANATIASAAPIFWCWHAFLDHVYYSWQFCQVVVPKCTGMRLGMARFRLKVAGLRVGTITRIPRFVIRPEALASLQSEAVSSIPRELMQITERQSEMLSETSVMAAAGKATINAGIPQLIDPLRNRFRGPYVIAQSIAAGTSVGQGTSVDLTVLVDA